MRVVYLLPGTSLSGGVRVVYQHAAILRERGVDAEVVATSPPSPWAPESHALYSKKPDLTPSSIGRAEVVVGTLCTTVPAALAVEGAVAFHLCQGYEGLYEPVRDQWPAIEAIYALPARKLVVSPHLVELIATRFGQAAWLVPQPFDAAAFRPREAPRPAGGAFRVLLAGQWEVPVKGIAWALEALRPLRATLPGLKLVRLAQDAPEAERAAWPDAERHVHVPPPAVPGVFESVDLFVGPLGEAEGFGLPALEAMATGLPCVLTDIGAFRSLDPQARASLRVSFGDGEALRGAVLRIARDRELGERLGREGRRIATSFHPRRTGDALLSAFEAALAGRWPPG